MSIAIAVGVRGCSAKIGQEEGTVPKMSSLRQARIDEELRLDEAREKGVPWRQ